MAPTPREATFPGSQRFLHWWWEEKASPKKEEVCGGSPIALVVPGSAVGIGCPRTIERSCCGLETSPRGLGAGRSRSSGEWYRSDIGQWVIVARVFAIDGNKMINQPSLVFLVGYVLTYEVW